MTDSMDTSDAPRIALIGFGEAGLTFARAGGWDGHARGWDIVPERRALMEDCEVTAASGAEEALGDAEIVLSLVTADAALVAAQDYAPFLPKHAIWCDMNSVAPETKRTAARAIEAASGSYVDVAIMSPVDPGRLNVPLLFAGEAALEAMMKLRELGFAKTRVVEGDVGRASAIKMVRSVMVKGLEALTYECAAAAEEAGIFDEVMASLDASDKHTSWANRTAYNRERMETHGARRAAEMEEAVKTLLDLGVDPVLTRGTVALQRQAAQESGAAKDKRDDSA